MTVGADAAWTAWANVAPVRIAARTAGLVRATLPLGAAPDAEGRYSDMRVIDERGREIPYAVDPPHAAKNARDVAPAGLAFVPHVGTQALFDLGRKPGRVNTIDLSVDGEQRPTYFERVDVDASENGRDWRPLRSLGLVYRVADDDGKGDQRVSFSATWARWLRVRILDPRGPFPLTGASVADVVDPREPLAPLPVVPAAVFDAAARRQVWTFHPAVSFRPAAVRFEGARGTFVRPVRIEASPDGADWSFAGDGTVARYNDGTLQTAFGFPEDTAAAWRVVMEDGDDAPLAGLRPVLLAVPHELVFEAAPGHDYWVLSGNAAAPAATYDLGSRLAHARWRAATADVGAFAPNAGFRDARSEWRHFAAWLTGAFVTSIVVGFAIIALRRERTDTTVRPT